MIDTFGVANVVRWRELVGHVNYVSTDTIQAERRLCKRARKQLNLGSLSSECDQRKAL
jgi:hypothetical protein